MGFQSVCHYDSAESAGSRLAAARRAGVGRSTLYRWIDPPAAARDRGALRDPPGTRPRWGPEVPEPEPPAEGPEA